MSIRQIVVEYRQIVDEIREENDFLFKLYIFIFIAFPVITGVLTFLFFRYRFLWDKILRIGDKL